MGGHGARRVVGDVGGFPVEGNRDPEGEVPDPDGSFDSAGGGADEGHRVGLGVGHINGLAVRDDRDALRDYGEDRPARGR
jgi:hypothetical protein